VDALNISRQLAIDFPRKMIIQLSKKMSQKVFLLIQRSSQGPASFFTSPCSMNFGQIHKKGLWFHVVFDN
jgi:hypothetical protein